jgi:hypothetical protein
MTERAIPRPGYDAPKALEVLNRDHVSPEPTLIKRSMEMAIAIGPSANRFLLLFEVSWWIGL